MIIDFGKVIRQFTSDLLCGYFSSCYIFFEYEFCFVDEKHVNSIHHESSHISRLVPLINIFRIIIYLFYRYYT